MKRKKIEGFHQKYPYVEPAVILLYGGIIGYVINGFMEKISIRFWENPYLIPLIVTVIFVFTYFKKFSKYSCSQFKSKVDKGKEKFDAKLLELSTKELENCNTAEDMFELGSKVNEYYDRIN